MVRNALFALALLFAVAPAAASDPPAGQPAEDATAGAARTRHRAPEIVIHGDVHEPQVTYITTRSAVEVSHELTLERSFVPALLDASSLPRGDG